MVSGASESHVWQCDTQYGRILLDEAAGRYWHANPAAALMLDILRAGGTTEEVVQHFTHRFDITEETARADVRNALDRFRARGLLV